MSENLEISKIEPQTPKEHPITMLISCASKSNSCQFMPNRSNMKKSLGKFGNVISARNPLEDHERWILD